MGEEKTAVPTNQRQSINITIVVQSCLPQKSKENFWR